MATLVSVNVGRPKDVPWQGRTVHTGAWKHPVAGPVLARRLNLDGDGQGDTAGHGGQQRAVLAYQVGSYAFWHERLGLDPRAWGQFGENLTIDGLPDDEVCIGDRYRIGEAEFEVTQPRVTCYRVGLRLGVPEMAALLVAHHRPGFYMRVLREGRIRAGDAIEQTREGPGALSITQTDALLYLPEPDPSRLRLAAGLRALSPGWRASFRDLLTAAATAPPAWEGFRPLRVAGVTHENADVASIHLADPAGAALPRAAPGQYLTLRLPEHGPVRSYSLSTTGGRTYRITVKGEGAASRYLTRELRPGATLDTAAPRGSFVLTAADTPVLLISAGIGLTPVLAMLHHLADEAATREVWWIHAARSPAEHPLAAEAHALAARIGAAERIFYSATTGRLDAAGLAALSLPPTADAYVCGPDAFMADMRTALSAVGVDPARIHTEAFGARDPINPGLASRPSRAPHPPEGGAGTGPPVTFARSALTVPFPATGSLLDLADACDVPTRWSCRTGVCHTCETPLLSGTVTHSPTPLQPPAPGTILLCCARPTTAVTVDV
ncbi:MOSC domain-containing protein [Dactylosporangium matsuzakiense]|uniref:Sulfurase n=1 Tax=Dactylosporangium matsuzakiense TaxID=53360 RepID=A0A9W6KW56_9ACTN|nr:MOSC domain-containing protein [Dactylosporangium matsuzakiense]UWZ41062.1 MOSC domain-containing protein [Dactylosporangium matsuzakiense]GLL08317.1 sulfurase [Dactylosporangium matsuzakiense]